VHEASVLLKKRHGIPMKGLFKMVNGEDRGRRVVADWARGQEGRVTFEEFRTAI
jgi:hypothetical protein